MRNNRIALPLFLAVLAMFGCQRETVQQENSGREIRFSASVGTYAVKAGDVSFEEGDAMGVSIGDPVNKGNIKLVLQNGVLTAEDPAYWGTEQEESQASTFWAYYPYAADKDLAEGFDFTIQPDQSTHAGYTASDLMTAVVDAAPSDNVVALPFQHRLTKLVLKIDNQLASEIAEVYVSNIHGRVFVQKEGEPQAKGLPGTVKCCPVTLTGDSSLAWALVLAPQTGTPALMVTTVDQKQFTYTLPEALTFLPGCRYMASITLNENSISSDFTTEVTEWVDDRDIQFGHFSSFEDVMNGNDGEVFQVEGTVSSITNWNYGNLTLKDDKGEELYIYGLVNQHGLYPKDLPSKWYDPDFCLVVGDRIALRGQRVQYDEGVELRDATLIYAQRVTPEVSSIQQVQEYGMDSMVAVSGIVYAVSTRGFILYDGNDAVLVYTTNPPQCAVGDEVYVVGFAKLYRGVLELANYPRYTVISWGNPLQKLDYTDITASFDSFYSAVTVPVSVEGVLNVAAPDYRIIVDGMSQQANVYWPTSDFEMDRRDGHRIRVKGFYLYTYSYSTEEVLVKDIVATELEDLGKPIHPAKYLTLTSKGTTTISLNNFGGNNPDVYYSTDKTNWTLWDYNDLTFTSEAPLYLCGDNPNGFSVSYNKYSYFVTSGSNYSVSGDVMSLVNCTEDVLEIPVAGCFYSLFRSDKCLISAPELPATTLAASCYTNMFALCSNLTEAPALPATVLAESCYSLMFDSCTKLASAPALPATTLAPYCYSYMFLSCEALTEAPELPAKTLEKYCYFSMFSWCQNIKYVKCLATNISADYCLENWLQGVAATGTFVKSSSMDSWPTGVSGIPEGWTVKNDSTLEDIIDGGEHDW